jgi:hypothetical protein
MPTHRAIPAGNARPSHFSLKKPATGWIYGKLSP